MGHLPPSEADWHTYSKTCRDSAYSLLCVWMCFEFMAPFNYWILFLIACQPFSCITLMFLSIQPKSCSSQNLFASAWNHSVEGASCTCLLKQANNYSAYIQLEIAFCHGEGHVKDTVTESCFCETSHPMLNKELGSIIAFSRLTIFRGRMNQQGVDGSFAVFPRLFTQTTSLATDRISAWWICYYDSRTFVSSPDTGNE